MSLKLPVPKAVIFDWDNTLVDTWPIIHDALNTTFSEFGLPLWTFEETRLRVRKSMRDSFPEVFGKQWEEAGAAYQRHYKERHLERLTALTGAEDVLKLIRSMKLYNTVVSNKKGDTLRREVEKLGWGKYFDAIVGSQDADRDKPHEEPVELALQKSPIPAGANVWFIGDSEIDLECAERTGCTAILYGEHARQHPSFTDTHFIDFPYHLHVNNHAEVMELLGGHKAAATA